MWIFCCGAYRSGSTLQYQICASIVESRGVGKRIEYNDAANFPALKRKYSDYKGLKIFKTHYLTPAIQLEFDNHQAKGVYCFRDIRDVAVSVMNKRDISFDELWKSPILKDYLKIHQQWIDMPRMHISKYETFFKNIALEVQKIADFLEIKLGKKEVLKITEELQMINQIKKLATSQHITQHSEGVFFDKFSLLHQNHFHSGAIGQWQTALSKNEVIKVERLADKWLVENGYKLSNYVIENKKKNYLSLMISKLKQMAWGKSASIGHENVSNRERWIEKTLAKVPSGFKILDAGAGEQPYKAWCQHLEYVSQDFGEYDSHKIQEGLQPADFDTSNVDIQSDITAIPLPDASFDVVMCIEVLEHVPDPLSAFRELDRLLKPGGLMIITAPFASLTHFAPYHFSTGFTKYFYTNILTEGYIILEIESNGNFFEYLAQETRRVPDIAKQYSKQKLRFMDRLVIQKMLQLLEKLNKKGNKSDELLCFGHHIFAQKHKK